jgi:signal transduction histidine kinase
MTVRWRLTLIATAVFGVAFIAGAWGLVHVTRSNLVDSIEATQRSQASELARAYNANEELVPPKGVVKIGPDGRLHEYTAPPRHRQGYIETQQVIQIAGHNVTVVAERSLSEVNSTVDKLRTIMYFAVPTLIALVALATWYFAGRALRPVEAIRAEAESITGSTIHRRVPEPDADDEVGRLARTMNAMLERLDESSQRQRQFVSDASHELRSPLASIRTNLEVALRSTDRADWNAVAGRVLAEDARMEDTVSELLALARIDEIEGGTPIESLPEVDLDELVHDETVREHRVLISTTRVSAGRVHGRREQLARVVRNLLDNADRHARTLVAVELHDNRETGRVELTVDDDGPGIPVEDRERVFDRFTRLDDGRARDVGGLGLGLSMVKAIVEQHDGTVMIDDAPLGGTRITVTFPAA